MNEQRPKQSRPKSNANDIKRRQARRRKKLMKKYAVLGGMGLGAIAIIVAIVFLVIYLVGGQFKDTTTLEVNSDKSITFDEVEDFSESNYDKSELKDYTKDLISEYNDDSLTPGKVKFGKVKVKDDKAYLRTEYSDYSAYSAFTGNEVFIGTIAEAQIAGYDFQDTFVKVVDKQKGDAVSTEDVVADIDNMVVVFRANVDVMTPKDILFISGGSTEVKDNNLISVNPPDGNSDATQLIYVIYKK